LREARETRVREYVEQYRRMPETVNDVAARVLALRSVMNLPWDEA